MSKARTRLWDGDRQAAYLRARDEAIGRQADRREGTSAALTLDATWSALSEDERLLLAFLLESDARSCVGSCGDPLLAGLVDKGLLGLPPGVRPVLTDDLATSFLVPPAVWSALQARRHASLPSGPARAAKVAEAARRFADRITPVAAVDAPDPVASSDPGAP